MFSVFCSLLSVWAIPLVILTIPLAGYFKKVKVYEVFIEGAAEGFSTAIQIMPFLVAMLVAVSIFRVSGAMEQCVSCLQPVLSLLHVPAELVPLALMRPLSGTGSLGLATDLFRQYGPDSLIGKITSTILGSTDTTFYIITVYFGAVGITRPRYSLFVGLLGDLVGFFGSIYICRMLFSGG
jgi:spore maturation protein B